MKTPNSNTTKALATALFGAASLFTAASTHAAFQLVPYGGVTASTPLSGQGPLGGTVVTSSQFAFSDMANPAFNGFLRSIVVDADGAGPGTALDFYYQIQNDSPGAPLPDLADYQIFTFSLQYGFGTAATVSADWVSSLGALGGSLPPSFSTAPTVGKTVFQAFRDIPMSDGAGFTFDSSNLFGDTTPPLDNIGVGQVSNWLVLRTTTSTYDTVPSAISYGFGAADPNVASFAPAPEPSTALLGLLGIGVFAGRRFRRSSVEKKS